MFWTAFIWGLGASCGASIGLIGFCLMFGLLKFGRGDSARSKQLLENNEKSLEQLTERNRLTVELIARADKALSLMESHTTEGSTDAPAEQDN